MQLKGGASARRSAIQGRKGHAGGDPDRSSVQRGPHDGVNQLPGAYHVVSNTISPNGLGFISAAFDANHVFQYFGYIH
jgi:hypothetical protein